jgi:hypothetical protein
MKPLLRTGAMRANEGVASGAVAAVLRAGALEST